MIDDDPTAVVAVKYLLQNCKVGIQVQLKL